MMTLGWLCAKESACADLPLAVGPAIITIFCVMDYIIICSAGANRPNLSDTFTHSIKAALGLQAVEVTAQEVQDHAMLIYVATEKTLADLDATLQEVLRGQTVDAIAQLHPKPRYKLLISDMDSTMIQCECIDELADFVGKKDEVSAITERAMNGELDFEAALNERVALLAGLDESVLEQCYNERVQLMPGAKGLLAAHKAAGGYSVLVSGGFTYFTSRVAEALGFDEHYGNQLEIKDGKLTGKVLPPILGKEAKLQTLQQTCKKLSITPEETLAIGDGANDLPMLLAAGLGVAYHAKPTVRAQTSACISYANLRALVPLVK